MASKAAGRSEVKAKEPKEVSRKPDGSSDAIADGLRTPGLQVQPEELDGRETAEPSLEGSKPKGRPGYSDGLFGKIGCGGRI